MSPILVRPVREQLEHDRIIRLLQTKYKRRFTAAINPGSEMNQAVGEGTDAVYPDVVLMPTGRARKIAGVVEVETQESVNALEAMAQWAAFGRLPLEFWLYVPAGAVDVAKRLCADNRIGVTEIWTYYTVGDQIRFTLVHRAPVEAKLAAAKAAAKAAAAAREEAERVERAARRAAARKAVPAKRKPAKTTKAVKATRPARAAKAAKKAAPSRKQR